MKDTIISAATRAFLRDGQNASIDTIIREAGIARQSVYNHFRSKHEILKAVIKRVADETMSPLLTLELPGDLSLAEALTRYAESYMQGMLNPDNLALTRLIGQATIQYPDIGEVAYQTGRSIPKLAAYLRGQAEAGRIMCDEPEIVAEAFFGALVGSARFRYLLNVHVPTTAEQRERFITEIVRLFCAGLEG